VLGGFLWLRPSGHAGSGPAPGSSEGAPAGKNGQWSADGVDWDGARAPIDKTIADRRLRDELRRRIFESWAHEEGELAKAGRAQRLPQVPTPANDDALLDPSYIQSVIREDMMPMAMKCYEDLLKRNPTASGRIEMAFKIIGDDKLGGIIEDADIDGGVAGALGDEQMRTCMTESLLSLSFRPPPKDGWVTVVYPVVFSPDGDNDD
jgi:hypothetical protein